MIRIQSAVTVALVGLLLTGSASVVFATNHSTAGQRVNLPREIAALPRATEGYKVGDVFPDLKARDQYQNKFSLKKLRGKYVFLTISAWWCPPSKYMGMWLAELKRRVNEAGVKFDVVTIVLQTDEADLDSTRAEAEAHAFMLRDTGSVTLYNPYEDFEDPETGGPIWIAYTGLNKELLPTNVMIGPDGKILDIMTVGYEGKDLFDYVETLIDTPLPRAGRPASPLDRADLALSLVDGDGAKIDLPKVSAGDAYEPFDTGVLANPGGPGVALSSDDSIMEVSLSGQDLLYKVNAVVNFPAGSPPSQGVGSITLRNLKTRLYGDVRPLGLDVISSSLRYCERDPSDESVTNCTDVQTGTVLGRDSVSNDFALPAADDNTYFPLGSRNMYLELQVEGRLMLPGTSLEHVTEIIDSLSWNEKTAASLNKKILRTISQIPKGKACKQLDKITGKITKFAGPKVPAAEATTVNAMIAGVQDLLVCDFTSVTTTTTIATTTTSTTTTTVEGGGTCDGQPDCQHCAECTWTEGECEDEYAACVNEPDCIAYWECMNRGETDCDSTYPAGAALYNAMLNCTLAECPTTCGGTTTTTMNTTTTTMEGGGSMCDAEPTCQGCSACAQLTGECQDEAAACGNEPECDAYLNCWNSSGGSTECDGTYPVGAPLGQALINCVLAECPTTCS